MIILIGLLCGMNDLGALIMAFALTARYEPLRIDHEVHNQTTQKTNWTSGDLFLWFVEQIQWFCANLCVFYLAHSVCIFLCVCHEYVAAIQKIGLWKNYLYGERTYF
jgi:hypothetical protein